jgi:hypothetical protein
MLGIAGIPSAFAGDDAKSGDACCADGAAADHKHAEGEEKACCAAKGDKHEKVGNLDLAPCEDEGEEAAPAERPADWARLGVMTDAGFYPVNTCAVTGEALDVNSKKLHHFDYEGRLIVTCCPGCESGFRADPARFVANLDAMIKEQQRAIYPITSCPVSGEELGGMGEPVEVIEGNYLVRLCCAGCGKAVHADPSATIAKLEAFYSEKVGETEAETTEVASAN